VLPPPAFLGQQVMMVSPFPRPALDRWVGGPALRAAAGLPRPWLTYLALLGIFMAMHGKDYYLAPAYPC